MLLLVDEKLSPILESADSLKAMMHSKCFDGASIASNSGDSSTLVTSREGSCKEEDWSKLADEVPVISEGPVAEPEALALLQDKLQGTEKYESDDMVELSRELCYVPLAMEQAAAYILQRKKTITEYLDTFRSNTHPMRDKFLDDALSALPSNKISTDIVVMKTWYISFKHFCKHHNRAAGLLSQMSFCDRQSIPKVIFTKPVAAHGSKESEKDFEFWEDVRKLKNFCFITTGFDDTFIIHRLVQLATRLWLEMYDEDKKYKGLLIRKLKGVFPKSYSGEKGVLSRALFPHVREVFATNPDMFTCSTDSSTILCRAAQYSRLNGNTSIGMMFINGILERDEKSDNNEGAKAYACLFRGREYIKELQWSKAEESLLKSKRIMETAYGRESEFTLSVICDLMHVYTSSLDARKVLDLIEDLPKGNEKKTKSSLLRMRVLEEFYRFQKKWQEAEDICEHMLVLAEFVFKDPDQKGLQIMKIRESLYHVYAGQEKWAMVKKMSKSVLDHYEARYGCSSEFTICRMEYYAGVLSILKEHSEAKERQEYVLEVMRNNFPESIRRLRVAEMNLLTTRFDMGEIQPKSFIEQMLRQLDLYRTAFGEDHEFVLRTWHWAAKMMRRLGDLDGAIREMRACWEQKKLKYCNGNSPTVEESYSLLDTWEEQQRERERKKAQKKRYRMMKAFGRIKGRLFGCFSG